MPLLVKPRSSDRFAASAAPAESAFEADFGARVLAWQERHGRRDLPWQGNCGPYAVWVSEIMLQQTQVATVIPYFERFLARFPDVRALAAAERDCVMQPWSGLGYYSRARNLHAAAREVVARFDGVLPSDPRMLASLPGVGRSTAGAIAALAFGVRTPILDANVKRVLCRAFGIDARAASGLRELWALAERLLPHRGIEAYTQGMMDLGATVCLPRAPRCAVCPLGSDCVAGRAGDPARFPPPRARAARREDAVTMLILEHGARILLEKRPPSGIWGGLWCLPQMGADADPVPLCAGRFGAHDLEVETLPLLVHDFTHLRLHIHPLRIRVRRLAPLCAEPGAVWLPLAEARAAALPAPVRKLLESV